MKKLLTLFALMLFATVTYAGGIRILDENPVQAFSNDKQFPRTFSLSQNYPNPFRNETTIRYEVKEAQNLKLSVINVLGQTVKVVEQGWKEEGNYEKRFEAGDLPTGIYICILESKTARITKRMILQD